MLLICLSIVVACQTRTSITSVQDTTKASVTSEISLDIDSTKLIDSLYRNVNILQSTVVDSFNCNHTYKQESRQIEVNCIGKVYNHNFGYMLILSDTGNLYKKEFFEPSDEYDYGRSFLFLDGKMINITGLKYINDTSLIDPLNVWYGKNFGFVAKYYHLDDREVFLIRGINYFCNGNYCTNYKIIVLQKFKDTHTSAALIDYPGNYPYNFENTFLFYPKNSKVPKLYIVKKGHAGIQQTDFEAIAL
ncbi:MAG: hypothetical protein ABIP80_01810 [Ferruginibacter sp.]